MEWNQLSDAAQIADIDRESNSYPVLIYKHSGRCGVCTIALARLEKKLPAAGPLKPYMIDVLKNRMVSDRVAAHYGVQHESPQVLLIREGKCVLTRSHMAIDPVELLG